MQVLAQQEPTRNSHQEKSDPDAGIIAEWPLKQHERLRVSIEDYKGAWLINVRKWYRSRERRAGGPAGTGSPSASNIFHNSPKP